MGREGGVEAEDAIQKSQEGAPDDLRTHIKSAQPAITDTKTDICLLRRYKTQCGAKDRVSTLGNLDLVLKLHEIVVMCSGSLLGAAAFVYVYVNRTAQKAHFCFKFILLTFYTAF